MKPVSVFIMDVSKSSEFSSGEELSHYLSQMVTSINYWFNDLAEIQISHRSGDEVIFLGNGFSSAIITAFYVSKIWKFPMNPPYFGLAFGSIEQEIKDIEIEKWIHPLANLARNANDHLKNQKSRAAFQIQSGLPDEASGEIELLLNGILKLQHALTDQQTDIQRLVCSLYLVLGRQKTVAELIGRSTPTTYSHFKKGHCELILNSFREVIAVLDSLQSKENPAQPVFSPMLEANISHQLKGKVRQIYEL